MDNIALRTSSPGRGTTTISTRALHKIARHETLGVPGSLAHHGSLSVLTGRDYPVTSVRLIQRSIDASISIASVWPSDIADVAEKVRDRVQETLAQTTGVPVVRVDVHVDALVGEGS